MKEIDKLNLPGYKADSKAYEKLRSDLRRILKFIPSDDLIKELRKRKIISKEWNEETQKIELIKKNNGLPFQGNHGKRMMNQEKVEGEHKPYRR